MNRLKKFRHTLSLALLTLLFISIQVNADVITQWNIKARNIVVTAKLNTPVANRALAIVHTAVYEAVNAITKLYPATEFKTTVADKVSIEAAVAAVNYETLSALVPIQQKAIDKAYYAVLKKIPDGTNKEAGIKIGKQAAVFILSKRLNDSSDVKERYRPHTTAGKYVPTVIPAVPHWPSRKPWMMSTPEQFRPVPPPALKSKEWAKDFNEVKMIGEKNSKHRSNEQTKIAKFWQATLPPIYHGVIHSVAKMSGRNITQNARLFATVTRAIDDAMIAVFEAKYHYGFWRPVTAIRNADIDKNNKTKRDASWMPYIPTPMHPEYPCAHCVLAGTVGAILKAEIGDSELPVLTTNSITANGAMRSWLSIDDFVQEVSNARIYDGVHYRTSTEVGTAMGIKIGELAIEKYLQPQKK